jgi:hypothetical protein
MTLRPAVELLLSPRLRRALGGCRFRFSIAKPVLMAELLAIVDAAHRTQRTYPVSP